MYVSCAASSEIKSGTSNYLPIVPNNQHQAAFYGIAKAAGDTTQASSENAVGTYTDDAKLKIQQMFGLYKAPYRLIKEITITETTNSIYVNKDSNGDSFSLTDVLFVMENVVASASSNGGLSVNDGAGLDSSTAAFVTVNGAFNTTAQNRVAKLHIEGGRFFGESISASFTNTYGNVMWYTNKNATGLIECNDIHELYFCSLNNHTLSSGTIKIYGR